MIVPPRLLLLAVLLMLAGLRGVAAAEATVVIGGQRINGYCVALLLDLAFEPPAPVAQRARRGLVVLDDCQPVAWRWFGEACDVRTCVGVTREDEVGAFTLEAQPAQRGVTAVLATTSAAGSGAGQQTIGLAIAERQLDQRRVRVLERRWVTPSGSRCFGGIEELESDSAGLVEVRAATPLALVRLAAPDATGITEASFEDHAMACGGTVRHRLDPANGQARVERVTFDAATMLDPPDQQPLAQCLARVLRQEPRGLSYDLAGLRALGQRFLRACPAG